MIGLDTNVLARFFAQDDPEQGLRAEALLQSLTPETPGFISLVSLTELVWVLRGTYRMPRARLVSCLERLLDSPELVFENHAAVTRAVSRFATSKTDFADCLIECSGHVAGCRETVTFDVNASKAAGMRLL